MRFTTRKMTILLMVGVMVGAFVTLLKTNEVYADCTYVNGSLVCDGSDTGGRKTTCDKFVHGYQRLCGSPLGSAGGGASWHLYKTGAAAPSYASVILTENKVQEAVSMCTAGRYEWMVVYGWDGPTSRGGIHYGPAALGTGTIAGATYNDYGVKDQRWQDVVVAMLNGSMGANTRLNQTTAVALWQLMVLNKGNNGSYKTGYFCVNEETLRKVADPDGDDGDGDDDDKNKCKTNCDSVTLCNEWAPDSYKNSSSDGGTTSVVTKVRNVTMANDRLRDGNNNSKWSDVVYAKPTDVVYWQSCYFPGVQKAASFEAVTVGSFNGHTAHNDDSCDVTTNSVIKIKDSKDGTWQNWYRITNSKTTKSSWIGENTYKDFTVGVSASVAIKPQNHQTTVEGDAGKKSEQLIKSSSPKSVGTSNDGDHPRDCDFTCSCGCDDDDGGDDEDGEGSSCEDPMDCPCGTTKDSRDKTNASINWGQADDSAMVHVPYNFMNISDVQAVREKDNNDDDYVYSGETVYVSRATTETMQAYNSSTLDIYATQVDSAKVWLIAYVSTTGGASPEIKTDSGCNGISDKKSSEYCQVIKTKDTTLNASANLEGAVDNHSEFIGDYNVFDANAGDFMCFRVAVYPATSGEAPNMNASGDGQWYYSAPSCLVIAKRPSFQVWGGSLYTLNSVRASVAGKRNVYDVYGYEATDAKNKTLFGSWVEQSIVSDKYVNGLASGAAMGLADMRINGQTKKVGGSKEGTSDSYCKHRVPLSLANYDPGKVFDNKETLCPYYSTTGMAGITAGRVTNRGAIVDYWGTGAVNAKDVTSINLNNLIQGQYTTLSSPTGVAIKYVHTDKNLTINGGTINKSNTYIIRADGDIEISRNISYTSEKLNTTGEIPKVVIYAAGGGITIDCGVTRVDAILIADKKVNTCSSKGDVDAEDRQHQLTVNGMVISDGLTLNRTYGAARGTNSKEPAEIFNYDTSALLWGRHMAGAGESDTLTTVYQHEIAPRY